MRAVVIGDSHTHCIAQAALAEPTKSAGIQIFRFRNKRSQPGDGTLSIDEAKRLVAELPKTTPLFLCMLGTYHNILGMLRTNPLASLLPDEINSPEQGLEMDIIPRRALSSAFDAHIENAHELLEVSRAANGQVYLLSSPPPKESSEYMLRKLSQMKKPTYRGSNVAEVGINPPALRRAFWDLECARLRSWSKRNQIVYMPAPSGAFDAARYLKECYYAEDATHANAAYGALVIEQILERIADQQEGTDG